MRHAARLLPILLLAALVLGTPALAQQPAPGGVGSNAAQDRGVHPNPSRAPEATEQQLMNVLRQSAMPDGPVRGNVYIPDAKAAVLVQPEGRTWRDFRVGPSRWTHAILFGLAILAVLALALLVGAQRYTPDPEGRRVRRFTACDRFMHWMTAVSFVVLALTGLNVVFGRLILQPWMGDRAFAAWSGWALVAHNFTGYAFLLGILLMAGVWMRHNLFHRVDWQWLRRGGGIVSHEHPPAEKFNAGQKLIYWVSILGGLAMGVTGVLMMIPTASLSVNGMQLVQSLHTLVAAVMIAVIIGHIYLGVWGVRGSFDGMARGDVDLNWARSHHSLWVERLGEDPGALARPGRRQPAE
ncbi:formate dehydrogenase subunit gamma [Alsobacter sp. R-9]